MQRAAERTWGVETGVIFTGWQVCPTPVPAGTIEVRNWTGLPAHATGNYIAIDFNSGNLESTFIHEMGHSLAFQHEQARADSTCTVQQPFEWAGSNEFLGGTAFGPYDLLSTMNYCNPVTTGRFISPTDIAGAGAYYGRPHVVGAASWGPGRIDVFSVEVGRSSFGSSPQILNHWASNDSGANWGFETFTDGTLTSAPAVVSEGVGKLTLVGRGANGSLFFKRWNGSSWSGWVELHTTRVEGGPSAVVLSNGQIAIVARRAREIVGATLITRPRLVAFILGTDDSVIGPVIDATPFPDSTEPGSVMNSEFFREPIGAIALAKLGNGIETVFLGQDGSIRHVRFATNSSSTSLSFVSHSSIGSTFGAGSSAAMVSSDGKLEMVFKRLTDNALIYGQFARNPVTGQMQWGAMTSIGGLATGAPSLVSFAAGRLDLFVRGGDGGVWHRYKSPGGAWNSDGFLPLGGTINGSPEAVVPPIAGGQEPVGLMSLVSGASGQLFMTRWTGVNGWSGFVNLGGTGVR
jgi:hypothetical protein